MQVDFYHLTFAPVERVLPRIAERVLQEGSRLLIVSADACLHFLHFAGEAFLEHVGERLPDP